MDRRDITKPTMLLVCFMFIVNVSLLRMTLTNNLGQTFFTHHLDPQSALSSSCIDAEASHCNVLTLQQLTRDFENISCPSPLVPIHDRISSTDEDFNLERKIPRIIHVSMASGKLRFQ